MYLTAVLTSLFQDFKEIYKDYSSLLKWTLWNMTIIVCRNDGKLLCSSLNLDKDQQRLNTLKYYGKSSHVSLLLYVLLIQKTL